MMIQSLFYLLLLLALPLLLLYFVPSIVAISRGSRSALGIFALNILAGWTLIGWLLLLAWALLGTTVADEPGAAPYTRRYRRRTPAADTTPIVDAEVIAEDNDEPKPRTRKKHTDAE